MKYNFFTSKYTSQFSCIGSSCEDNCCQMNWKIFMDKEEYEVYQKLDATKETNLLQHIEKNDTAISEEAYATIEFNSAGECSFLTAEKLCQIQIDHGFHALCKTCKLYPRTTQKVHHAYYETCYLSCPEIARIVLLTNTSFEWGASISRDPKDSVISSSDFPINSNYVKKMHKHMTHLLRRKEYSLSQRIRLMGVFVNAFCHGLHNKMGIDKAAKLAQKQVNIELKHKRENVFELKIPLLLNSILKMENDLHAHDISPRFQECLQLFKEGMEIHSKEAIDRDAFLRMYKNNYDTYYKPFFTQQERILENYCSYYLQHQLFPYDRNMLARNFLVFNIEFSILQLILVGVSASPSQLNEQIIVQLFQSYSKIFQHYPLYKMECIDSIHDELLKYTTDYLQLLTILVSE
ncbi:flagellin lysine-N-methylase [Bacillus sp. FSL K6-0268]|uniref:flagellin lysine-N-methylase n=1 Tax=Bacillus sp. FSL K6-0268 TaxID=2921449 RepID=UPI0030F5A48C